MIYFEHFKWATVFRDSVAKVGSVAERLIYN